MQCTPRHVAPSRLACSVLQPGWIRLLPVGRRADASIRFHRDAGDRTPGPSRSPRRLPDCRVPGRARPARSARRRVRSGAPGLMQFSRNGRRLARMHEVLARIQCLEADARTAESVSRAYRPMEDPVHHLELFAAPHMGARGGRTGCARNGRSRPECVCEGDPPPRLGPHRRARVDDPPATRARRECGARRMTTRGRVVSRCACTARRRLLPAARRRPGTPVAAADSVLYRGKADGCSPAVISST